MTGVPIASPTNPSKFTPKRLLALFCLINSLNYIDRGVIASNGVNGSRKTCSETGVCSSGSGIQGAFDLNNFEDGVISSAFLVGLLGSSPIFASLAKSVNPFRLIGVGLTVWTLAVGLCGFSFNFWSIAICRMLVGVGEASFVSLAAPFIDDIAPSAQRTAWLGAFYMCIPTGVALGYVYGGLVGQVSWRLAFWTEAILMVPFATLGFLMKPLDLKGFSPAKSKSTRAEDGSDGQGGELLSKDLRKPSMSTVLMAFVDDVKIVLLDKVYLVNILGCIAYNFVIGAYSYWGPKAGYNIYHMSNADYLFGGITAVSGIFGSVAGGLVLDRMTSSISNAFKLMSFAAFMGTIFCFTSFCFKSLYAFLPLFFIGEVLIFATQAPVNFIYLHCVKPSLRPLSMALSTVCIHVFGDVPSSPLVGLLQDHVDNWRMTSLILTSVLFISAAIWFIGVFLHASDRYNEDTNHVGTSIDKLSSTPLLEGETNADV